MSSYRALITDLDGTAVKLTSDGSDITEAACTAVKEAQQMGYKIACATGRRWQFAKPVVSKLGITSPCIIEGGTRIINPLTEETVWEKFLDSNALAATLDIFQRESDEGGILTAKFSSTPISEVSEVPEDARFMYLLGVNPTIASAVCNAINGQGFAVAHMTPSWSGGGTLDVHVTHTEATKEHAIQAWQKIESVTKDQTIGIGDSGNDVPLFQSASLKVAVGNATPELTQLADYIAPNQDQDALAHVINRFLVKG